MVHIGYFIDDICLPPADLTGTCHGSSFYGFTVINITPTVSPVFYSVDLDTKYIATLWSFSYNNSLSK